LLGDGQPLPNLSLKERLLVGARKTNLLSGLFQNWKNIIRNRKGSGRWKKFQFRRSKAQLIVSSLFKSGINKSSQKVGERAGRGCHEAKDDNDQLFQR